MVLRSAWLFIEVSLGSMQNKNKFQYVFEPNYGKQIGILEVIL